MVHGMITYGVSCGSSVMSYLQLGLGLGLRVRGRARLRVRFGKSEFRDRTP